jgi:hypothetical protein
MAMLTFEDCRKFLNRRVGVEIFDGAKTYLQKGKLVGATRNSIMLSINGKMNIIDLFRVVKIKEIDEGENNDFEGENNI